MHDDNTVRVKDSGNKINDLYVTLEGRIRR
jgi:hypothetical protein